MSETTRQEVSKCCAAKTYEQRVGYIDYTYCFDCAFQCQTVYVDYDEPAGPELDFKAEVRQMERQTHEASDCPYEEIVGEWPGDESDEEIQQALEELS